MTRRMSSDGDAPFKSPVFFIGTRHTISLFGPIGDIWKLFGAPKSGHQVTPPEIAQRIQQVLAEGFLTGAGAAALRAMDVEPVMSTPAEFARTVAQVTRDLRALADRLGIKPTE